MDPKILLLSYDPIGTFKFIIENIKPSEFIGPIKEICTKYLYKYDISTNVIAVNKYEIHVKLIRSQHSELILDQYNNLVMEISNFGINNLSK